MGQPDDGVHRRADLVAHVGQEGALGPIGRVGLLLGRSKLDLGAAAGIDPPEVVANELELAHIRVVIVRGLVADPDENAHQPFVDHGDPDVADEMRVARGVAAAPLQVLVVVVHDRSPEADAIRPDTGLADGVVLLMGGLAGGQRPARPGRQPDGFLVVGDEMKIADLALREPHRLVDPMLQKALLIQRIGQLAHVEHGAQTLVALGQGLVGPLQLGGTLPDQRLQLRAVLLQRGLRQLAGGDVLMQTEQIALARPFHTVHAHFDVVLGSVLAAVAGFDDDMRNIEGSELLH